MLKRDDFIYITTPGKGYFPQLKMSGPVVNPIKVPVYVALNMIIEGNQVFRYNPHTRKTVPITMENILHEDSPDENVVVPTTRKTESKKKDQKHIRTLDLPGVEAKVSAKKEEPDKGIMRKPDPVEE